MDARKRSHLPVALGVLICLASAQAGARDGDLESSFAFYGYDFQSFPGPAYLGDIGIAVIEPVLQADGKILVAASKKTSLNNTDFGVLRLEADGSLDTAFGVGGAATLAFDRSGSDLTDFESGLAIQSDGKILLAGFADGDSSTDADFAVARLTSAGTPDAGFGTNGKAVVPFNLECMQSADNCSDYALRVDVQPSDGKILVVGEAFTNTGFRIALARLTTGGERDSTFDTDGRVTIDYGGDAGIGFRARQLADGQHVLVVGGANSAPGGNLDFAMARLDDAGQLDPAFGVGGKATYAFDIGGDDADIARDFAELPDGRIVVCGSARVNGPSNDDFACMRFLADGKPDPTFTPSVVPFDVGGNVSDVAMALRIDAHRRIVVAGHVARDTNNDDFGIVRLLRNGGLDPQFGVNGRVRYGNNPLFGTDRTNFATGTVIQPDDNIVVAGYSKADDAGDAQFQVMRLTGNDTIFDDDLDGD